MTTQILQERDFYFTLLTNKGKEIGVDFGMTDRVSIYIKRSGMNCLSMGKHFDTLCEAIDAYKSSEIKRALKDLARHLGVPSYIYA